MEFVHEFFNLNRGIIYFSYGLVFFVLGLAIALQSRQSSRLDLARSLAWLSAFGFTHAFHEWGDLFIPIQQAYLSAGQIQFLFGVHLLLLAVSFTLLFEFGVALLNPLGRLRWLHIVPAALLAVWIFVAYFPLATYLSDFETWHNTANALARYALGFPGALLAAYALRQHALQRIAPLQMPQIYRTLQLAGWCLALYAVFGGLLAPPAPFFPANVVNTTIFEQVLVVPPQLVRSIVGLGLALAMIRGLEVFDLETARMIEAMEQQQILTGERSRLARELHDGAIQKVYTAGLLVQSGLRLVDPGSDVLHERLEKAVTVLNDAIKDLRQNLGELHTTPGAEPLPEALRTLVADPRFQSLVKINLDLDLPEGETISPGRTEHLLAIVNEALSNVVRHSRAHQAMVRAGCSPEGHLLLTVEDDGVSLPKTYQAGFGLRNMRDRARLLGGNLEVTGTPGKGTRVALDIPWRDERS
jgi:signal transduction histidine kinase